MNDTMDLRQLSWKERHPGAWTHEEVLDWAYDQAERHEIKMAIFKGEMFQNLDGQNLCEMSFHDFTLKDENFGGTLYFCLQELLEQYKENSWHLKHPESWCNEDILDWIYCVADLSRMNLTSVKGEQFQDLTGQQICRMNQEEFALKDPLNGDVFFNSLHHLLSKSCFSPPDDDESFNSIYDTLSTSYVTPEACEEDSTDMYASWNLNNIQMPPCFHSISTPPPLVAPSRCTATCAEKRKFGSGYSRKTSEAMTSQVLNSMSSSSRDVLDIKRLKAAGLYISDKERHVTASATPRPSSKKRLWKFMRDLLDNPLYNPEYIRWESQREGIFRIVSGRSKAIAQMWGRIKNNPTMTFDKLGRSLRWCRANNGLFSSIPKNGRFPKKLCFRFTTD